MNRNSFTLIEVLVCLLLLSMVGSVVVYKGWQMLQEHKFSTSCEKMSSEVALTRVLAVTYQMDIDLVLEQRGGNVYITRKTDFPPAAIRSVFGSRTALSEAAFRKGDGVKEIHFYGNGWIEGDEKVTFFMPHDTKKEYSIVIKHSSRVTV